MDFFKLCNKVSFQMSNEVDSVKTAFAFTETSKHLNHKDINDLKNDFLNQSRRIEVKYSDPKYNPKRKIDFSFEFTVDKKPINIIGFSNNQLFWEFKELKKEKQKEPSK